MSRRKLLRAELRILEKQFPKDHERFQIALATPEELVCRFISNVGDALTFQCNLSVSGHTEAQNCSVGGGGVTVTLLFPPA